jgi:hypothetical protein
MSLAAGTKLGPYEVIGPLGSGGMGEVYRARDTRLGRDVAVKVLPGAISHTAERLRRFEQEARLAGSLSHPNVLTVFDVGVRDGAPYLVTELLEGRSLRDVLGEGPLATRRAVECAQQAARGLAAAHERGVVHRDLKPANLFVTKDGRVKVLDFGLAKLTQVDPSTPALSKASTETAEGLVVGTVGYMSPEQVRGQAVDARSDIFALGAVIYEMLSGRRAFGSDTPADTMTAILTKDPEELSGPGLVVPSSLDRIVRRCLEKDPAERFQSAKDVAFALEAESGASRTGSEPPTLGRRPRPGWLAAGVAGLALLATGVALGVLSGRIVRESPPPRATFADIALPPGVQLVEPTYARLSLDGRRIAFVGLEKGGRRLWLRDLDSATTRPLPGTEGGWAVAWSGDGRRIAFNSPDLVLRELEVETGGIRTVGSLAKGPYWGDTTGSWNEAGGFLVPWGPLFLRPASGGPLTACALPDPAREELYLEAPRFLANGRHYIVGAVGRTVEQSGLYVGALGTSERRLLLPRISWAALAPPRHLLFQREGMLLAQGFDADRGELVGQAQRLLDGVYVSTWGHPTAWVGGDTLVFVGGEPERHQLTWFDRAGREAGRLGEPDKIVGFDLSGDGTRVVASIGHPGGLRLLDALGGTSVGLPAGEDVSDPRLRSDGRAVLFSRRGGIFRMNLDGGFEELVLRAPSSASTGGPPSMLFIFDWSRDGRVALYTPADPNSVWSLPIPGGGPPRPVVRSTGIVDQARFSPDGRWVAYNGDESGRMEVLVVPFPPTGERWQVSTAGGVQPLWRGDGRELFYLEPNGNLMSVDVRATGTFASGPPRLVFRTGFENPSYMVEDYAVTADGRRFLLRMPAPGSRPPGLKLVLGWRALLGQ